MKIGIVSDSHGKVKPLKAALDLLVDRGVETIVHCGDVGSVECVESLGATGVPTYLVPGNMDRNVEKLQAAADRCHVNFAGEVALVPIGAGRYLGATHGNDAAVLHELIAQKQFPYVCHGHTHRAGDERIGNVRVINPGALRHARNPRRPTAAVLDTDTDTLEYIKVR
jgi:putative phosphoesterase